METDNSQAEKKESAPEEAAKVSLERGFLIKGLSGLDTMATQLIPIRRWPQKVTVSFAITHICIGPIFVTVKYFIALIIPGPINRSASSSVNNTWWPMVKGCSDIHSCRSLDFNQRGYPRNWNLINSRVSEKTPCVVIVCCWVLEITTTEMKEDQIWMWHGLIVTDRFHGRLIRAMISNEIVVLWLSNEWSYDKMCYSYNDFPGGICRYRESCQYAWKLQLFTDGDGRGPNYRGWWNEAWRNTFPNIPKRIRTWRE